MSKSPDTDTAVDIRRSAMDLLARREHSQRELRDKLLRRYSSLALIQEAIETLAEEGLQSDARFAESFLRQRVARGQGPLRIRQEMKQRGIEGGLISEAFASHPVNWLSVAAEVLEKKFSQGPAEDIHEKARRTRFLQYRGFGMDEIRELLD